MFDLLFGKKEIAQLKSELSEAGKIILALRKELSKSENSVSALRKELSESNEVASALQEDVSGLKSIVHRMSRKGDFQNKQIQDLKYQLQESKLQMSNMENILVIYRTNKSVIEGDDFYVRVLVEQKIRMEEEKLMTLYRMEASVYDDFQKLKERNSYFESQNSRLAKQIREKKIEIDSLKRLEEYTLEKQQKSAMLKMECLDRLRLMRERKKSMDLMENRLNDKKAKLLLLKLQINDQQKELFDLQNDISAEIEQNTQALFVIRSLEEINPLYEMIVKMILSMIENEKGRDIVHSFLMGESFYAIGEKIGKPASVVKRVFLMMINRIKRSSKDF